MTTIARPRTFKPNSKLAIIILVVFFMTWPNFQAHAASGGEQGSLGLQLGLTFPSLGGTTISYGLQFAYKVLTFAKTQAFAQRFSSSVEVADGTNTVTASSSTTVIGLTNSVPVFSNALNAGIVAGLVTFSSEATVAGSSNFNVAQSASGLFIGPNINKDFTFTSDLGMSTEIQYLHSLSSGTPKIFQLLAGIKYTF